MTYEQYHSKNRGFVVSFNAKETEKEETAKKKNILNLLKNTQTCSESMDASLLVNRLRIFDHKTYEEFIMKQYDIYGSNFPGIYPYCIAVSINDAFFMYMYMYFIRWEWER